MGILLACDFFLERVRAVLNTLVDMMLTRAITLAVSRGSSDGLPGLALLSPETWATLGRSQAPRMSYLPVSALADARGYGGQAAVHHTRPSQGIATPGGHRISGASNLRTPRSVVSNQSNPGPSYRDLRQMAFGSEAPIPRSSPGGSSLLMAATRELPPQSAQGVYGLPVNAGPVASRFGPRTEASISDRLGPSSPSMTRTRNSPITTADGAWGHGSSASMAPTDGASDAGPRNILLSLSAPSGNFGQMAVPEVLEIQNHNKANAMAKLDRVREGMEVS